MDPASIAREFARLIFPPRCQLCHQFCETPICLTCRSAFEELPTPICLLCGLPFHEARRYRTDECVDCRNTRRRLAAIRSFGEHKRPSGILRGAINDLKFRGNPRLGAPLGLLLAPMLTEADHPLYLPGADSITAIVPVPLHEARLRERGYNQAELIADALGAAVGRPVRPQLMIRTRNTRPQVSLTGAQRAENVRNAFRLSLPLPVEGVRVLLVDDVYTTGATLEECARTLLRAGAETVSAVTVTRPVPEE